MISNKFPGCRQKDVILVPLWISQRLVARQLEPKDILDFNRISKFIAINDLAQLLVLQDKAHYIVGDLQPGPLDSMAPTPVIGKNPFTNQYALRRYWETSALTEQQRILIGNIFKLAEMDDVSNAIVNRMFSDDAQSTEVIEDDPFIINDVDTDLCIMTIRPGYFSAKPNESKELRVRALEQILRSFYRTVPSHEVSRTEWFKRYLEILSAA